MDSARVLALFGGSGTRFGGLYPKQFFPIDGTPLLLHTLRRYQAIPEVSEILVVSEESTLEQARTLIREDGLTKVVDVIPGGESRQESARKGLAFYAQKGINEHEAILIVDGDRPCVERRYVHDCLLTIAPGVGAVTTIPSSDSLLLGEDGDVLSYLPREKVQRVQTPQGFCFGDILKAHEALKDRAFTDDASMAFAMGLKIRIVDGNESNVKITRPSDIELFRRWNATRK